VWNTLASRYKSNPLVGFDLYNEPHDVSDSVWHSGGTVTSSGVTYQAVGMQTLYNTVRATGATNLVFASGTNWATNFPTTAPLTATSNLIYAAHAYTCPTGLPSSGASCTNGPDGTIYDPSGLLAHFSTVALTQPVMVTEFGFPDKNDGRYITNVQNYASSHGFVGWDVYAFDNSTGGLFDLWKNTGSLIEPAASGMAVITGLLSD
jgi:endoglucanase